MKNAMREIIMIAEKAIIGTSSSFAKISRNFKPSEDHISCKLEYDDYDAEKNEIKLNDFQGQDFMITIQDSKPHSFKFSETWDFQICDEKIVSFQDSEYYLLANNGALWIYTKQTVKGVGLRGGAKTVTTYYFSKGGDSGILELTPLNLKASFPDNHMLHDAIDAQFKSATSLGEYDKFHKHYKINHFLETQNAK